MSTTTYAYNGDGDRVSQTVDGVTTSYVLDTATSLTMVLSETTGPDTIYYLHGLGLVAQSDGSTTEYFYKDALGSVRQISDVAGDVLFAQTFDPYGNAYAQAGVDSASVGYAGEFEDSNGLLFLRARFYNPTSGRFLNTDPSRQEMNPYQYGGANPIIFTDPTGLLACDSKIGKDKQRCLNKIKSQLRLFARGAEALGRAYPDSGWASTAKVLNYYLNGKGGQKIFRWSDLGTDLQAYISNRVRSAVENEYKTNIPFFNLCNSSKKRDSGFIPINILENTYVEQVPSGVPDWYSILDTFSFNPIVASAIEKTVFKDPEGEVTEYRNPYYLAFGTATFRSINDTFWRKRRGKYLTTFTAIEVSDHYDWCWGGDSCEASDTHPGGYRAGEMFALENASMAAQFSWYIYGIVEIKYEILPDRNLAYVESNSYNYKKNRAMWKRLTGSRQAPSPLMTYQDEELDLDDWDPAWDANY